MGKGIQITILSHSQGRLSGRWMTSHDPSLITDHRYTGREKVIQRQQWNNECRLGDLPDIQKK